MERVIAFSIERVLVRNALQLHRNFGVPLAFPQRSISRSICIPVTRSLLGYFCPVLYIPKETLSCFLNNFEWPPLRLSAVRLRWSGQFSEDISQHFMATCHYRRFTVVIYLLFICGRFRNHRALRPLPSEKLLQCSFWCFVDTQPIVWSRLRTHFAGILNSQLMYTVQLLIVKGGLTLTAVTLISESMVSFADSPFKFLLLPPLRF